MLGIMIAWLFEGVCCEWDQRLQYESLIEILYGQEIMT